MICLVGVFVWVGGEEFMVLLLEMLFEGVWMMVECVCLLILSLLFGFDFKCV